MPDRPHDVESLSPPAGDSTPDAGGRGSSRDLPRAPGAFLAEIDQGLLVGVARSGRRQPGTSPTPEVVEVVADLGALARLIVEHNRRVMAGEPYDWAALADAFAEATCVCRRQVVIELGDAGSR